MPWADITEKLQFSADKLKKVGLFDSERMLFDVYCVGPGQEQKAHAHADIDKVYMVLSGAPTVILGEEERVLHPGQAAWAPPGVVHGLRNDTSERATLLVFQARAPAPVQDSH